MSNQNLQDKMDKMWQELKKHRIYNVQELDKALKDLKLINIGCFVTPLNQSESSVEKRNVKKNTKKL